MFIGIFTCYLIWSTFLLLSLTWPGDYSHYQCYNKFSSNNIVQYMMTFTFHCILIVWSGMRNLLFNALSMLWLVTYCKTKYFFHFAAHYHLNCFIMSKTNINTIISNSAYQLKDLEARLKVVLSSATPYAGNIESWIYWICMMI